MKSICHGTEEFSLEQKSKGVADDECGGDDDELVCVKWCESEGN